eukprot:2429644-Amphidinium_carterae.1
MYVLVCLVELYRVRGLKVGWQRHLNAAETLLWHNTNCSGDVLASRSGQPPMQCTTTAWERSAPIFLPPMWLRGGRAISRIQA